MPILCEKLDPAVPENICEYFADRCPTCDIPIYGFYRACVRCGTPRPRCSNEKLPGSRGCVKHDAKTGNAIVRAAADAVLPIVAQEADPSDRSFTQELAAAKRIAKEVYSSFEDATGKVISPKEKLKAIKEVVAIGTAIKKLESGTGVDFPIDDKMAATIRQRFLAITEAYNAAIDKYVSDRTIRENIRREVRQTLQGVSEQSRASTPRKPRVEVSKPTSYPIRTVFAEDVEVKEEEKEDE
jgi:hypothetical protein